MTRRAQVRVGLLLLVASMFLVGCTVARSQKASRAKDEMVGMSKSQVLTCMGVPASQASEGGVEVWSYNSGGDSTTVGSGTATTSGGWLYAFGASKRLQRYCKVNVVFQNDYVSTINYSGRTGGVLTAGEQCAFAIDNCVQ